MKILFTLFVLLTFISCKVQNNKKAFHEKTKILQITPEVFIQKLPGKLSENSGLIFYNNLFWTFNDSGGKNKIYGFNISGKIKKEIEIKGAKNVDWEDIAQDEKYIYIGDFGNNSGQRKNQKIYKIKKKKISKKEEQKLDATEIKFDYQNQKSIKTRHHSTPFDCESLVELNDNLYIFTKDWTDRTTSVYQIPSKKGEYKIKPIEKFNVTGLITGADISPNKKHLALVGYKNYKPILWLFSNFKDDNFFSGQKTYVEMDKIFDAQTEGICFLGNDSLLISCEQSGTFNHLVFLIDLETIK